MDLKVEVITNGLILYWNVRMMVEGRVKMMVDRRVNMFEFLAAARLKLNAWHVFF